MPQQSFGTHLISDDFGAQGKTATQVNSGTTVPGGQDSSSSTVANAASDAQKMAIQIIQAATQGAGKDAIVSRPQVIMPQPRTAKPMPTDSQSANQVQATTKAGQRRNDMQSLISNVGNVVKAGLNKKNEKNEQSLMHDLAIIQAAASNPDDPHNRMILNGMMNDPKVVKRLQKALGYNPLSGEEAPPEAKTLQKFGAQVKQKQQNGQSQGGNIQPQGKPTGAMDNLMSRMPNTQQINPVVAMQAELIKAGILPKNDLGPKSLLEYVGEVMKNETKLQELKTRAEATNNQTLGRLYDTLIRAQTALQRGKDRDASQERQTHERSEASKYGADARERAAGKRFDAQHGNGAFKNLKEAGNLFNQDIQRLEEQLATALKQSGGKDSPEATRLKSEITQKKAAKDNIEKMYQDELGVPTPTGVNELEQAPDSSKEDEMNLGDFVFNNQQQ